MTVLVDLLVAILVTTNTSLYDLTIWLFIGQGWHRYKLPSGGCPQIILDPYTQNLMGTGEIIPWHCPIHKTLWRQVRPYHGIALYTKPYWNRWDHTMALPYTQNLIGTGETIPWHCPIHKTLWGQVRPYHGIALYTKMNVTSTSKDIYGRYEIIHSNATKHSYHL